MIDISSKLKMKNIKMNSNIDKHISGTLEGNEWRFFDVINHLWEINIDFEDIRVYDSKYSCSLCIDNINLGNGDWTNFQNEEFDDESQEDGEVTFYFQEHHTVDYYSGSITYIGRNIFEVSLKFRIRINNHFEEPMIAEYEIKTEVNYDGLEVHTNILEINPDPSDIKRYIKDCVNLNLYEEPFIRNEYLGVLKPKF